MKTFTNLMHTLEYLNDISNYRLGRGLIPSKITITNREDLPPLKLCTNCLQPLVCGLWKYKEESNNIPNELQCPTISL